MRVIDGYVVKAFLSSFLILMLVGMGLYVVGDLLVNLDEFTKDRTLTLPQIVFAMFDYYRFNVPLYYKQLGGPVMAMAAAFTLATMLRQNELTAVAAAGVPLQRLAVPIIICALFLLGIWVANSELLIPRVAAKIARQHGDIVGETPQGVNCVRDARGAILVALELYPREGRLNHVYIAEPSADGRPTNLITADSAQWDPDRRVWKLDERGKRLRFVEEDEQGGVGGRVVQEAVSEYPFGLAPEEMLLQQASEFADMLSVQQMKALVQSQALPTLPTIIAARHVRLTQPLLQLILMSLAMASVLSRAPTNVLAAGGRALLICGLFFGATFVAHSIISARWSALVTWAPILIFGPLAAQRLASVKT